jgi:hypothetical protein
MQLVERRGHVMKRVAVIIGSVIAVAATPTVVAASQSDRTPSGVDIYQRADTWSSQLGQLYGPVKAGQSSYGFLPEFGALTAPLLLLRRRLVSYAKGPDPLARPEETR